MQSKAPDGSTGSITGRAFPLSIPYPSRRLSRGMHLAMLERAAALVLDVLSVLLAFWLAYLLRYDLEIGGRIPFWADEPFSTFIEATTAAMVLTPIVFAMRGIYGLDRYGGVLDSAAAVVGGFTTSMAGVVMLAFFLRFAPSRLLFLYVWVIGIVLMLLHRRLLAMGRRWLWSVGIGVDRVLIVGDGEAARRVMQAMFSEPHLGYRLVGFASDSGGRDRINVATERGTIVCPRLGTGDQVGELVTRHRVDEVIIAVDGGESSTTREVVTRCREQVVKFRLVPDLVQFSQDRASLGEIAGVPLIGISDASIRGWNAVLKRSIDICVSAAVLVVAAIPMLVIAWLIKRDSPGPVLFRQTRVGKDGRLFTMLKFRCMVEDAEAQREALLRASGTTDVRLFKMPDDPRLTRIGKRLRRLSLDELPQFVQVLKGDMSLIGPRPPIPEEVRQYEDWHLQRLLVKPGLTGLWQVNGRSHLSFDEMVRLDLYYAENWSPWLDTKILLRTIPAVLAGRGAW
ncbi:MAG TPA: sugar transferase [Thermomicrobiales bacterium]|nr:sugar transferase [Thermomicrobiales bacterium]